MDTIAFITERGNNFGEIWTILRISRNAWMRSMSLSRQISRDLQTQKLIMILTISQVAVKFEKYSWTKCLFVQGEWSSWYPAKKPYLPCISMAGRALLAGYHRFVQLLSARPSDTSDSHLSNSLDAISDDWTCFHNLCILIHIFYSTKNPRNMDLVHNLLFFCHGSVCISQFYPYPSG